MLRSFEEWRSLQRDLPPPQARPGTLLLIRLDDIGDYLLFRNQLAMYKRSPRWCDHRIVLLANESWRELCTLLDADAVDEVIWVDKNRYLASAPYRWEIWSDLRRRGFETVVATSRTRPLLLDDLCMLAAAPIVSLGCVNEQFHARLTEVSDALYGALFQPSQPLLHEFRFNAEFSSWVNGIRYDGERPRIELPFSAPAPSSYLVCFVGASIRSKRWPVARWIEFLMLYRRRAGGRVFLAGRGDAELEMVRMIQERTDAQSIAGGSFADLLRWIAGAAAVVSNDTMAAHLGVSLGRPTVIVANGINYMRFAEYRLAGIAGVTAVYPDVLRRRRLRRGDGPYDYSEVVSADIASIPADAVLAQLEAITGAVRP